MLERLQAVPDYAAMYGTEELVFGSYFCYVGGHEHSLVTWVEGASLSTDDDRMRMHSNCHRSWVGKLFQACICPDGRDSRSTPAATITKQILQEVASQA